MLRSIWSISSLLGGMAVLLTGSGLLGILIGLRAAADGFGSLAIGIVMSGFYVGYMAGSWVCPPLILRVGHIRAFASFAASAAALSLAYGLVVHPVVWYGLRVLNGLMIMGIYVVIESWLNERARGPRRGRIFALYMMTNLFAVSVGQYLLVFEGIDGLGSFALAAILFCLGLLPIALTPLRQPVPIRTQRLSVRLLFRASRVGTAGAFGSGLALGAFWSLSAIYARSLGLGTLEIAHFTASAIIGGALMQWPIGWASDRHDRRRVMVWVAIGGALALVGLASVDLVAGERFGPAWYVPLSFTFGAFVFSLYGLAVAQTQDRFPSSQALEATKGLLLLHGMGAAVGPLFAGAVMHGLQARGFPIAIAIVMVLLAAYTAHRIRKDPPVPPEARGTYGPVDPSSPIDVAGGPRPAEPPTVVDPPAAAPESATRPSRRTTDTIDDTPQAGLVREASASTAASTGIEPTSR